MTIDILTFVEARLAEDAQVARDAEAEPFPDKGFQRGTHIAYGLQSTGIGLGYQGFALAWDPARVLAEVAAKRRVLARHAQCGQPEPGDGYCDAIGYATARAAGACPELLDLAAPYADHPDYKPEWKINA